MPLIRYARKAKKLLRSLSIASRINSRVFDNRPNTLAGPNRNYTKFIIIGHQRSGSSLIIGSLREHRQVVGFGELFVQGRIGFNVEGYDNFSKILYQARKAYPIEFLNRYIFSSYQVEKRAVGFKLFPDQLDNQHFGCVWDWIEQNQDIAVIFLSRRNKLAAYTSLLIAKQTGVYGITDESQRPSTKVTVDAEECFTEFRKRDRYEAIARERIANHSVLEIIYEDLSEDPRSGIMSVQGFLGLDHSEPAITSIKQEVRPLSDIINNYYELKERFADTKWSSYFEEK